MSKNDVIDRKDKKSWSLYADGLTKGIFQLDSNLGKAWSKKLAPENLEELAALIALIRPGCISWDTKIICSVYDRSGGGKFRTKTIKQLYESFHKDRSKFSIDIISIDENYRYIKNRIEDVIYSGVKDVYSINLITRSRGKPGDNARYNIKATLDHKFLLPNGEWKELKDLKRGDRIAIAGNLSKDSVIIAKEKLRLPKTEDVAWAVFDSCYFVEKTDTYDITCAAPYHNFVAGNFIVHNCLKAIIDGKSMTQRFIDRKHKREPVTYIHESLEEILKPTYGVLVYQEQAMLIAVKLAGFNEMEADNLRKAIGKKKADLMAEIRKEFINGCNTKGIVTESVAKEIFGWIEKSSRYSFNKSHAVAYALDSYWSAYYKANNTKEFFLASLYYASEKPDPHEEIYELINEAKLFNIEVGIPKLSSFKEKFNITTDGGISFGIKDIKSMTGVTGDKVIEAIKNASEKISKSPKDFTWMDVLVYLGTNINSTAFKSLASIGFFSTKSTNVTRNEAVYQYLIFKELTKTETDWIANNYPKYNWIKLSDCFKDLHPIKKNGGGCSNANRSQIILNEIEMLKNPPYSLSDDPAWVIEQETKMLGCPISLSRVDAVDTSVANTTCKDVVDGKKGKNICIVANVQRIANHKINKANSKQKGRTMSFLTIEDATCSLDSVIVFPDARDKYQYILYEGNNLMLCGEIDKDSSFIVEKIHEI
jgi:DNA polymerase III alpha subunit